MNSLKNQAIKIITELPDPQLISVLNILKNVRELIITEKK